MTLGHVVGARDVQNGTADTLSGVRVLSDYQLEVRLTEPTAFFPAVIAQGPGLVVDRATVGEGNRWHLEPNGSGPYRASSITTGTASILERSPRFLPRRSGPNTVQLTAFDPGEALLQYEHGQVDIVSVNGSNVDRFSDPREPHAPQLQSRPSQSLTYVGFNTSIPPFDDHRARRAVAHSIERSRINRVTLRGHQSEARGILPPGIPGHQPMYTGLPFDLDAAYREIRQSEHGPISEWPDLVLVTAGSGLLPADVTRSLVEPWQNHLGLTISVEKFDFTAFLDVLENLESSDTPRHMFLLSWVADFPDAFAFLDVLFRSDQANNYGRFSNHFVDVLLDRARRQMEPRHRAQIYALAESRIVELAAIAPLTHGISHQLVQPWVARYPGQPVIREWLTDVTIAPH